MLDYAKSWARRLAINTLAAALALSTASAQTVIKQPLFIQNQQWADLGNGPLDVQPVEGGGAIYSSQGTGVGSTSGSSTTLTLTGTPAIAPCVGCIISGTGITSGTTVTAFNGTTGVTLSSAMTVAASTALSWGAACPAATATNVPGVFPNTVASLSSPLMLRTAVNGVNNPLRMYTQARLCAYGQLQSGFTFLYSTSLTTIGANSTPAGATPAVATAPNPYPAGSTAITGIGTGTTGAVVGTLTGATGKFTYICGFDVSAIGGTAAVGPVVIAGLTGGSFTYQMSSTAAGLTLSRTFSPCIPSSAVNTNITVTTTADGTATAADVNSWGFTL